MRRCSRSRLAEKDDIDEGEDGEPLPEKDRLTVSTPSPESPNSSASTESATEEILVRRSSMLALDFPGSGVPTAVVVAEVEVGEARSVACGLKADPSASCPCCHSAASTAISWLMELNCDSSISCFSVSSWSMQDKNKGGITKM